MSTIESESGDWIGMMYVDVFMNDEPEVHTKDGRARIVCEDLTVYVNDPEILRAFGLALLDAADEVADEQQ